MRFSTIYWNIFGDLYGCETQSYVGTIANMLFAQVFRSEMRMLARNMVVVVQCTIASHLAHVTKPLVAWYVIFLFNFFFAFLTEMKILKL